MLAELGFDVISNKVEILDGLLYTYPRLDRYSIPSKFSVRPNNESVLAGAK